MVSFILLLLEIYAKNSDSGSQDETKYESFTYLDRNAYLLIQSNLFHLEGSRYVKKVPQFSINSHWLRVGPNPKNL